MTILCYHSVRPGWESPLAVEPDDLAWQAAWLQRRRTVLPLREALGRLDRTGRLPRGEAALTFDDGFSDLHTHALPILSLHRLPATVFLVAQTLTPAGQPVDWVDTAGSEHLTTLTLEQVLEMQDAGIEFESHSWAHRDLTGLSVEECIRDLRESRELLSDLLGRPVTLLAYPRGLHNRQVREAAEKAGYTHALALPERAETPDRYAVPRVGIYRGNSRPAVRLKAARSYLRLRTSDRVLRSAGGVRGLAGRLHRPVR
jgi:peptidoglycan/xylan/chitin deacetylase (PgdA/CDA1 family)